MADLGGGILAQVLIFVEVHALAQWRSLWRCLTWPKGYSWRCLGSWADLEKGSLAQWLILFRCLGTRKTWVRFLSPRAALREMSWPKDYLECSLAKTPNLGKVFFPKGSSIFYPRADLFEVY